MLKNCIIFEYYRRLSTWRDPAMLNRLHDKEAILKIVDALIRDAKTRQAYAS